MGFVCEIFFFCLDTPFCLLCDGTLNLLPLGKLSHLTQEIIVTGGLALVWGHAQSQGQGLRKLTFGLGPQLRGLIPSHEERLQPPRPATVPCSTGPASSPVSNPRRLNTYAAGDGNQKEVKSRSGCPLSSPLNLCLLPSRDVEKINLGFKHLESSG